MRVALLPDRGFVLTASKGLWLRLGERDQSLAATCDFNPYFPLDPLAVAPDGRHAWVRGRDGAGTRVDLDSGASEGFDFGLRDAVYGPEGTVFAVLEGSTEAELVEFDDRNPNEQRQIPCPTPQRIHWPFGPPYRYAAYDLDWSGALRLTATRFGVALAHVSGLLWVRFSAGPGRFDDQAWIMPPVYQGWTCAYAHADGLVVTSVHNGRTGDIVWLDRQGIWHDCFDSTWESLGVCVPSRRGFVAGYGDWLLRFEGSPGTITERVDIGDRCEDAAVSLDGDRVAVRFGNRVVVLDGDQETAQVWFNDDIETLEFEQVEEPCDEPPWRYQAIDDPDLGRLWKPDLERARALAKQLHEQQFRLANLPALLPGPIEDGDDELDLVGLVLRRIRRWIAPALSRAKLLRVVERLAAPDDEPDEYVAWSLRQALPAPLREAGQPQSPANTWLRARVPGLFEGRYGERIIRDAVLVADVHCPPAWSLLIMLDDDESMLVTLDDFDPSSLAARPSEQSDEFAVMRGELTRWGKTEPVVVTLDPFPGGFAHRVVVSRPRGGDVLLRTGAWFEPPLLESVEQARVLAYGAESWPTLYTGLDADGRLHASPFAEDLVDARRVAKPSPLASIRALIDGLVDDELLELSSPLDDASLWAVEAAVLGLPDERATAALETLLLKHEGVEELFATTEQLHERVVGLQG
ncbi:MAG: hypothetical protein R6X02_10050 [Enhygromyxa sp.]